MVIYYRTIIVQQLQNPKPFKGIVLILLTFFLMILLGLILLISRTLLGLAMFQHQRTILTGRKVHGVAVSTENKAEKSGVWTITAKQPLIAMPLMLRQLLRVVSILPALLPISVPALLPMVEEDAL
jgi:hypothetical protein